MSKSIAVEGKTYQIPGQLQASTKRWFRQIVEEYNLESHHVKLLTMAAEAWDRSVMAQQAILEHGIIYTDGGKPRTHPAVKIKEAAEVLFARLVRELNLDIEPPRPTGRPPGLY